MVQWLSKAVSELVESLFQLIELIEFKYLVLETRPLISHNHLRNSTIQARLETSSLAELPRIRNPVLYPCSPGCGSGTCSSGLFWELLIVRNLRPSD